MAGWMMGAGGASPSPTKCVWEAGAQPGSQRMEPQCTLTRLNALTAEASPGIAAYQSPLTGRGGNMEPSGSFVDAREGSPSHPLVRCLWTSCLASLNLRLLICKTGINMPISQACSELAEFWLTNEKSELLEERCPSQPLSLPSPLLPLREAPGEPTCMADR